MSRKAGDSALDVSTICDTFDAGGYTDCPVLDTAATFDPSTRQISIFVVNRTLNGIEATLDLQGFRGTNGKAYVVNGPDIKTANSFDNPEAVTTREMTFNTENCAFEFEPHSFTAICFQVD